MPFKRVWDSSCPHVWDSWEADGVKWVIQDLPPEDDAEALQTLMDHMLPDERLCTVSELSKDPVSVDSMREYWRECLAQRTSLACYQVKNGAKKLVALNVCIVTLQGEEDPGKVEGAAWQNVFNVLDYLEHKIDVYKYLGLDKVLHAMGLVVRREYRGARLGARVLNAREPLSAHLGIKATATVFTGEASQKLAARCNFTTLSQTTFKELADIGLKYPSDDQIVVKYMIKKYQ